MVQSFQTTHAFSVGGVNRVISFKQLAHKFESNSTVGSGYKGNGHGGVVQHTLDDSGYLEDVLFLTEVFLVFLLFERAPLNERTCRHPDETEVGIRGRNTVQTRDVPSDGDVDGEHHS